MANEDFTVELTAEDVAKASPNAGGGFKRIPFGDYKVRLIDCAQQAKQGEKPHVMLKATFAIIQAHDPKNAHAVGMTLDGLYAGSRQSPKFMQDRLANLLKGASVVLQPGQALSKSMLIGREFDASILWELGKPVFDETTGAQKQYVNSRLIAERPSGQPRPQNVNPEIDSREATKFLEDKYGSVDDADPAPSAAPWAQPQADAAPAAAPQAAPATASFRPEAEADATVMQYRAYVKLDTQYKAQAREALVQSGFDPDGPIDAAQLPEPVRSQYLAKFPQGNGSGLPPLPPPTGAKKGTRSPKTT